MFEQIRPMVRASLSYLALGWSVIPLGHHSKKPAFAALPRKYDFVKKEYRATWEEFQQRHASDAEINRWFAASDFNIGIVTGQVSGIVGVDCDLPIAYEYMQQFVLCGRITPISKTPNGYHLLFKHPGYDVSNYVGTLGVPGLDIRGDGGYIAAAPSIHPDGLPYQWLYPAETPLLDLPFWFFNQLQDVKLRPAEAAPPSHWSYHLPTGNTQSSARFRALIGELRRAKVPAGKGDKGTRNKDLNRVTFFLGQMVGLQELDQAEVERELWSAARDLGLRDTEIKPTIDDAMRAGIATKDDLVKLRQNWQKGNKERQRQWWEQRNAGRMS